jgi:hypothetical protein
MDRVKFPKLNSDRTFCVEITMSVTTSDAGDLAQHVQRWWTENWMQDNQTWRRVWNKGDKSAREEVLRFDEEFSAPPRVSHHDGSEFRFRLEGRSSAKFWKDWWVHRITPDLKANFPEIGEFRNIRSL